MVATNMLDLVPRYAQLITDSLLGLESGVLLGWRLFVVPEQEHGTLAVWSYLHHFINDFGKQLT